MPQGKGGVKAGQGILTCLLKYCALSLSGSDYQRYMASDLALALERLDILGPEDSCPARLLVMQEPGVVRKVMQCIGPGYNAFLVL